MYPRMASNSSSAFLMSQVLARQGYYLTYIVMFKKARLDEKKRHARHGDMTAFRIVLIGSCPRRSLWDSLTGWVVSRTPQEWMTVKNKGLESCRNKILGRNEDSRSGMYT